MTVNALRELMREVWDLINPDRIAERLNRWLIHVHEPLRVDDEVICRHCSNGWTGKVVYWPCEHWIEAERRIKRQTHRSGPAPCDGDGA